MATNKAIVKYFDDLSRKHVDIRHSSGVKKFFRLELEDILIGNIKTIREFPIVCLERLEYRFVKPVGQTIKRKTVALMFVAKVDNPTPDSIDEAYDSMESVADDFLNKTWEDVRLSKNPFADIDWTSIDAAQIPFNETTKTCGVRLVFDAPNGYCDEVNVTKWK